MKPETIKKLMEDIPELVELRGFLRAQIGSLDNLSDILVADPVECAIEVRARQVAREKLANVLTTLLDVDNRIAGVNNEDYVM